MPEIELCKKDGLYYHFDMADQTTDEFTSPGATAVRLDDEECANYLELNIISNFIINGCGYYQKTAWHHLDTRSLADEEVYLLCLDGRGWFQFAENYHEVEAGDVVCCYRGVAHSYGAHKRDPWTIRWLHTRGAASQAWADALGFSAERQLVRDLQLSRAADALRSALQILLQGRNAEQLLMASTAAQQCLALIMDAIREKKLAGGKWLKIQGILQDSLDPALSLKDIASRCQLSIAQLSRVCRDHSGMSPIEYVSFVKMQRAAALLLTTERAIKDIAQEVGYYDPYYFSRVFKQKFGMSPRRYRSEQRR